MSHSEMMDREIEIECGKVTIADIPIGDARAYDVMLTDAVLSNVKLSDVVRAIPAKLTRAVVSELFSALDDGGTEIASEFVGEPDLPDEIEEAIARLRRGEAGEALLLLERAFYPSMSIANEAAARRRAGEVRP